MSTAWQFIPFSLRSLWDPIIITEQRAMLRRARYCYGKSSIRPSVCQSVTLRVTGVEIFRNKFHDWLVWAFLYLHSAQPNSTDPNGIPEIVLAGIGVGYIEKVAFGVQSSNISSTGQDRTEVTNYWRPMGNPIRAFDRCQNKRPWMTLKGHYALYFKTHALWC